MTKILLAALALSAALVATTAHAQGNRTNYGRPLDTPENRGDLMMRGSAFCVTHKASASASKVLQTRIASDEEAKAVKKLKVGGRECFQPQWPDFPPTLYRNALAEAAYRESYLDKRPSRPAPKEPPASFAVVPAGTSGSDAQQAIWQLAALARCVVFASPEESRQFVLGPRFVPEEEKRFAALRPALGRCTSKAGVDTLTSRNFRGYVGDALLAQAEGR